LSGFDQRARWKHNNVKYIIINKFAIIENFGIVFVTLLKDKTEKMMIHHLFRNTFLQPDNRSGGVILSGVLFVLIGLIILLFPEILIIFIASMFIAGGIVVLYFGWKLRKMQRIFYETNINDNV